MEHRSDRSGSCAGRNGHRRNPDRRAGGTGAWKSIALFRQEPESARDFAPLAAAIAASYGAVLLLGAMKSWGWY